LRTRDRSFIFRFLGSQCLDELARHALDGSRHGGQACRRRFPGGLSWGAELPKFFAVCIEPCLLVRPGVPADRVLPAPRLASHPALGCGGLEKPPQLFHFLRIYFLTNFAAAILLRERGLFLRTHNSNKLTAALASDRAARPTRQKGGEIRASARSHEAASSGLPLPLRTRGRQLCDVVLAAERIRPWQ